MVVSQPITSVDLIYGQKLAPQGQRLFWNNFEEKKTFGPTTAITILEGKVGYTPFCDGENNRVSNFKWVRDYIYTVSDIYITQSSNIGLNRGNPAPVNDVNNAPNTVAELGGVIDNFNIGSTFNIGNGDYNVIYDECQDKRFQIKEDAFFPDAITVKIPTDFKISASALIEFYNSKTFHLLVADSILDLITVYQVYNMISSISKWSKVIESGANGKFNQQALHKVIFEMFVTSTNAINADLGAGISIPTSLIGVLEAKIIDYLRDYEKFHRQKAVDPPNFNYENNVFLNQSSKLNQSLDNTTLNGLLFSLTNEFQNNEFLINAFISSVEHLQGAQIDGNPLWGLIHSDSINRYAGLMNQNSGVNSTIYSIIDLLENDYPEFNSEITVIENLRKRIQQTGFTNEEIKFFKNNNFTDPQINTIREGISSLNLSFTLEQIVQVFKNILKAHNDLHDSQNKFANELDATVTEIKTDPLNKFLNPPPESRIISPSMGFVNEPIVFNGSTSFSENGTIKQFNWDLDGDGIFNDSNENITSFTYSTPYNGYIGLKVTNTRDISNLNYLPLKITDQNKPPVIESITPDNKSIAVTVGSSQEFNITASDGDMDDLNVQWFLDGILVRNGNSFKYIPSPEDIGIRVVSINVTDNNIKPRSATEYWLVYVSIDEDLDTWNSIADCNDNNPNINPGVREIHYNGLDDDCNPNTLDNNTRPNVQNVTFETNQNQRTTIELPSNDVDDDVIDFAIVDMPVNGTLGNIIVTKETNYVGRATYIPNNNFHGIDHLTFIANDGKENSSVGRVDINVGINESPIAQNQDIEINEDSTIKITLQATNHDGHPLTFSIPSFNVGKNQGKTTFGILKDLKQTGSFTAEVTYSPIADYNSDIQNAQDSFAFEVRDGLSVPGFEGREKSGGIVSINVKNVNDSPNTVNQNIHTKSNTPIVIDLKGTDVENDVTVRDHFNHGLQFSIVDPPLHGTLSNINQIIQVNRSPPLLDSTRDQVTYTPQNNFIGKDSFTFITNDGISSSSFGNITITVQDPNTVIQRTEFEKGDIIIGTSLSGFQWYDSEGNHIKALQSNLGSWSGTGGAFDSEGNLYVTHFDPFSLTGVSKYAKNGNFIERWHDRNDFGCLPQGTPHTGYECMSPESIVIDKQDNVFVGGVARAEGDEGNEVISPDHRDDIRKFNSDGVLLDSFDVKVEDRGSDWMELDPNQCTMYYTSEDKNILRYDVCDDKQLSNFANTYDVGRILDASKKINYALRLLPTGEFLVASNTEIWKLDSQGSLIQKYDAPGENTWFALNVSPDGRSFWSASLDSPTIYKFDIQTGKILNYFTTYQDGISGIIIKGEPILSSNDFAPIVFNQTGIINENVPTLINLTGFDIANDPLTFNIIKGTNSGILSPISHITNNISQVTYTPNSNFDTDSFTFNANDEKLNSTNTGTITMIRNHAPIAKDDSGLATLQGIPISISILTNDTDVDVGHPVLQDNIRITKIDTSNTLGNVTLNADNTTINYVPIAPEYIGPDSFNYTIADRYGLQDTAQVLINVLSANNVPVAHDQSSFTMENTPKAIQLFASDADPDDQNKLVYLVRGGPQNGYLSSFNSTTGMAEYKPLKAFHGQDSFTFRVHDGKDRSNTASVNITVNDDFINDRPQVKSERISANVAQQINVNVLANDIDPNGDLITLTNFTGPFNGTAFLNPDQTITYQSDLDFNASDVLYYRVADSLNAYNIGQLIIDLKGNSLTQTIEVPESVNVVTKKNTPIDIRLLASSLIKRPLNFYIQDNPVDGTLSNFVMTADDRANVTYTPNTGFSGRDSFKYVVTDPKSGTISNIGTIEIIIEDVITNNPPVAKDQQVSVDEDKSIQIQLNATDPDTDSSNNVLTYKITTQSTSGQISDFDIDTGILTYKPDPDFNGPDSFTFKAQDNGDPELDSNVAVISIIVNSVNDAPVAVDDKIAVDEDISPEVMIPVLANDTDIDISYEGDSLSVSSITSNPTHGNASISSDKQSILYSPTLQYSGPDSLKYTVSDKDNIISNEATVSIRVNPVNDPPVAYDKRVQTDKETPLSIQLQGTDPDSGDSISSYIISNQPSSGVISRFDSTAGTLTYTPNTSFVGDDSFTFKVVDSNKAQSENTGTVSITVKDIVTPPPDTVPPGYTAPMLSSLCLDPANENTKGTQNDDNLVGTAGKETLNGLGGKDRINACDGKDVVNGNYGNDGINGDKGNDKINGNEGDDYLLGGDGNDEIHGNEGNDILKGGDGDDDLFGSEGDDILTGGTGADKFACGSGNDKITDFNQSEGDSKKGDCEVF